MASFFSRPNTKHLWEVTPPLPVGHHPRKSIRRGNESQVADICTSTRVRLLTSARFPDLLGDEHSELRVQFLALLVSDLLQLAGGRIAAWGLLFTLAAQRQLTIAGLAVLLHSVLLILDLIRLKVVPLLDRFRLGRRTRLLVRV